MQNIYIERNGREIQLTEEEIQRIYYFYDVVLRNREFERYKVKTKAALNKAKEKWEMIDVIINDKIIEHIAYSIRKSIEEFGNDEEWCFNTDRQHKDIYLGGFFYFYLDALTVLGLTEDEEKEK